MSNFSGTVYEMGEAIPNVVTPTITPKIYFDGSIEYDDASNGTVFDKLSFSSSVVVGEKDDDLWTYEEILTETLQYLNLHIVQIGYDFYVFNWASFASNSVTFTNIDDSTDTVTIDLTAQRLQASNFSSDGTQITIDDVYNQIGVKCSTSDLDEVIPSLTDKNSLTSPYKAAQFYCREYSSEYTNNGSGLHAFKVLVNSMYPQQENCYTVDWVFRIFENKDWKSSVGGTDVYSQCLLKDARGVAYDQWSFFDYLSQQAGASCWCAFGSGDKISSVNQTIENVKADKNYFVMSVNGNGVYDIDDNEPPATPPFPSDNDLKNMGIDVEFHKAQQVTLSPSDPSVKNYIVFSGDFLLQPVMPRFGSYPIHEYEGRTDQERAIQWWYSQTYNTFANARTTLDNINAAGDIIRRGDYIPDGEKGRYYQQRYNNIGYSGESAQPRTFDDDMRLVSPPLSLDDGLKFVKYNVGDKCYYADDAIDYIPLLECQLRVGDKYLVEYFDTVVDGYGTYRSRYEWATVEGIAQENHTTVADVQNNIRMYATFSLGIEPKANSYIVGDKQSMKNNITTDMGLSVSGLAIPVTYTDNLSGDVEFHILGPINVTFDEGFRRHPTWFRHTTKTTDYKLILPLVQNIWVENFKVQFTTDNGGADNVGTDNDVLYLSDEQTRFLEKKNNIDFKIMTLLTSDEMAAIGTSNNGQTNCVIGPNGNPAANLFNSISDPNASHEKPERLFVDSYYNLYKDVHKILETDIHIAGDVVTNFFKRYSVNWLDGTYYPIGIEYDLNDDSIKLKMRDL